MPALHSPLMMLCLAPAQWRCQVLRTTWGHGRRVQPECFALQVGASTLARVLQRLRHDVHAGPGVLSGLDSPDDAAVLAPPPPGHVSVQVPNPAVIITAGLTARQHITFGLDTGNAVWSWAQ